MHVIRGLLGRFSKAEKSDFPRLLAVELSRLPTITSDVYSIPHPSAVDDSIIPVSGHWYPPYLPPQIAAYWEASAQVVDAISQLSKALQLPTMSSDNLRSFDILLNKCIAAFPNDHQRDKEEYLHPSFLAPILYLQNARLLLHRQNLNQRAPPELRTNAINQCALIARETSRVMARCMQAPPDQHSSSSDTWKPLLRSAASAFLCTHLWRCILFLVFTADFEAASLCARASAVIGSARLINNACGRHLEFFLHALNTKSRASQTLELIDDEEMVAYVSGDLQGSATHAWVWQNSPTGSPVIHRQLYFPSESPAMGYTPFEPSDQAPEDLSVWTGWDGILDTLERLSGQGLKSQMQENVQCHSLHTPGRISIADIM